MRSRIPDNLLGKMVFLSGLVWMLFGAVVLAACARGLFSSNPSAPHVLVLPVFGIVSLDLSFTDFAMDFIHVLGVLVAALFCIAAGLAICVLVAPKFSLCKGPV